MELRDIFILNMKKYRKIKKLSQMNLAERCNTSTSYIGEIEIGKKFPSVEMIQRLAAALDIQPFQLFMPEAGIPSADRLSPEKKSMLIQRLQQAAAQIIDKEF